MGAKKKTLRVALDTNVLVSALILKGKTSVLVDLWRTGRITPVLSRETFDEFKRVLEYPKFSLSKNEIQGILQQEILPFFEVVERADPVADVCRDRDDDKFLACAASAKVPFFVSGDKNLCSLGRFGPVRILKPDQLLACLTGSGSKTICHNSHRIRAAFGTLLKCEMLKLMQECVTSHIRPSKLWRVCINFS
jgi:uncharacterized protein